MDDADTPQALLAAYDTHLRTDAEMIGAAGVTRVGPVLAGTFPDGRGHVTYPHPLAADEAALIASLAEAVQGLRDDPEVVEVEVKTRGHDNLPGLGQALEQLGLAAQEPESVMVGRAELLAVETALPPGVLLRRVDTARDVAAAVAMQDEVFDRTSRPGEVDELLAGLARDDGTEMWVAEADGVVVSAGRLEPVPDTGFAGLWGGATRPEWRGRGIYRALTAARARSALGNGVRWLHSDSTEHSRPILQRSGLVRVTSSTPYMWQRPV